MIRQAYQTDVLVVGGGTGGTCAAIQAARRGAKTILVSEFPWLGGMLTSAGVSVPDGNELAAFQTGLWGDFLQELRRRQPEGLNHAWVSFFSFDPRIGAQIFADWVRELPNLHWISGQVPLEVQKQGDCITGVVFADFTITAKIILDGTELGDLLALGSVSHHWGWEFQSEWGEHSAPISHNKLTQTYPVQAPTWVVLMQEFDDNSAPEIPSAPNYDPSLFAGAWDNYGAAAFLNYGRLPGGKLMINWPICGNDYGYKLGRLVESDLGRDEFLQECFWHSQNFAHFIQTQLGRGYGLAEGVFPSASPAFALHPYYRESRRLRGLVTVCEQNILPRIGDRSTSVAPIFTDTVAIGNYANDHHYPGFELPLQPKSIRWGGRWTGTPFTIPYRCLIPATTDGLLVCEKNISVSHIANGATRLQPVVMGIGQAAGMAAALCVEFKCQPRDLEVRLLQSALLESDRSKTSIVPLFNLPVHHPEWLKWQYYYLDHPETYPDSGNCPCLLVEESNYQKFDFLTGIFSRLDQQNYQVTITKPSQLVGQNWQLVTWQSSIDSLLQTLPHQAMINVWGSVNSSGKWFIVEHLDKVLN